MVTIAQLVEQRFVVPCAMGSIPISYPKKILSGDRNAVEFINPIWLIILFEYDPDKN